MMNKYGIGILLCFFIVLLGTCEKDEECVKMCYTELGCANPWGGGIFKENYTQTIKDYLASVSIDVRSIEISNTGLTSICESCLCPTGRLITITIPETHKLKAESLHFYEIK